MAQAEVTQDADVPPGSLRAQAEVTWDVAVLYGRQMVDSVQTTRVGGGR